MADNQDIEAVTNHAGTGMTAAATASINSLRETMAKFHGIADGRDETLAKNFEMETFNRYAISFPNEELTSLLSFVFIVRPDLNIVKRWDNGAGIELTDQCGADSYYQYINKTDPTILKGLTQTVCGEYSHHFVPFLFDRVDTYQIPGFVLETHEMNQPFTGFKTVYAGNGNGSESGQEFSIVFRETQSLRILKFFKAWVSYINGITLNLFSPRREYANAKYFTGAQVIDYATSIYLIKCKPDMEIVFFHKMTGAFPKTVPYENMSFNRGPSEADAARTVSIDFCGGYPESLNPLTLAEFNWNSMPNIESNYGLFAAPEYSTGVGFAGAPFVGVPFITYRKEENRILFYLSWEKII